MPKFYEYFWFIKSVLNYYSSFAGEKNIGLEMLNDFLKSTQEVPMWQSWDSKSSFLPLYQSRLLETSSEKLKKHLLNLFYFILTH